MNDSPSQIPLPAEAHPIATKPLADSKPAIVKNKVTVKSVKKPASASVKAVVPVTTLVKPAASKAPPKAKVKTAPVAKAEPDASPAQVEEVGSGAKVPAKATAVSKGARAGAPASLKAKPVSEAKKAKELRHVGKKSKLVRDSFTFPVADYALIGVLKERALKLGHDIKKSELLRAGLFVLSSLSDATLIKALGGIAKLKTGRPAK
jgi:hypothetical protein